ncbi:MAG: hypothetical protein K2X09_06215 [Rickettsiales bacterium]|nr:hypothetical protein [Rickettsiales bacterium]
MSTSPITSVPDFKAFARASDEEAIARTADSASAVFGKDGLTFGDVLDAINPLNHIPIVSDIYSNLVGHKASAGSRLAGGALFGGPIGLVASLATLMFEEGTGGNSPVEAVYAALSGSDASSTQLAAHEPATHSEVARLASDATAQAAPVEAVELASLAPASGPRAAPSVRDVAEATSAIAQGSKDSAVLGLYGASPASAHGSYEKAKLLPYLRDVTVSKVL